MALECFRHVDARQEAAAAKTAVTVPKVPSKPERMQVARVGGLRCSAWCEGGPDSPNWATTKAKGQLRCKWQ